MYIKDICYKEMSFSDLQEVFACTKKRLKQEFFKPVNQFMKSLVKVTVC